MFLIVVITGATWVVYLLVHMAMYPPNPGPTPVF
jgi:hypothetical protein